MAQIYLRDIFLQYNIQLLYQPNKAVGVSNVLT